MPDLSRRNLARWVGYPPARGGPGPWVLAARSGWDIGEEVSGVSRRGPWMGDPGGQPQVREDLADHVGTLDSGDEAHAATTARTGARVFSCGEMQSQGPTLSVHHPFQPT